jgi:Protein of unknown function (DUF4087)
MCLTSALPALAETRCGWIVNPTPGNWWLSDADEDWIMMVQGGDGGAPGMELIPDLTLGDWVPVNGSYGYGCACMEVETDGVDRILKITGVTQLALQKCIADPALTAP